MFLRLKLYVVFLLAKVTEKIADCLSFEKIIVCYLSFLLYIMILWFSSVSSAFSVVNFSSFADSS